MDWIQSSTAVQQSKCFGLRVLKRPLPVYTGRGLPRVFAVISNCEKTVGQIHILPLFVNFPAFCRSLELEGFEVCGCLLICPKGLHSSQPCQVQYQSDAQGFLSGFSFCRRDRFDTRDLSSGTGASTTRFRFDFQVPLSLDSTQASSTTRIRASPTGGFQPTSGLSLQSGKTCLRTTRLFNSITDSW